MADIRPVSSLSEKQLLGTRAEAGVLASTLGGPTLAGWMPLDPKNPLVGHRCSGCRHSGGDSVADRQPKQVCNGGEQGKQKPSHTILRVCTSHVG